METGRIGACPVGRGQTARVKQQGFHGRGNIPRQYISEPYQMDWTYASRSRTWQGQAWDGWQRGSILHFLSVYEGKLSLAGFASALKAKLNTKIRTNRKDRLFFMISPLSFLITRQRFRRIKKTIPERYGVCHMGACRSNLYLFSCCRTETGVGRVSLLPDGTVLSKRSLMNMRKETALYKIYGDSSTDWYIIIKSRRKQAFPGTKSTHSPQWNQKWRQNDSVKMAAALVKHPLKW